MSRINVLGAEKILETALNIKNCHTIRTNLFTRTGCTPVRGMAMPEERSRRDVSLPCSGDHFFGVLFPLSGVPPSFDGVAEGSNPLMRFWAA